MSQTPSSPRPRLARWFAAGALSLAVMGAGAGTAFASGGSPSPHAASHASVGMEHRGKHGKGPVASIHLASTHQPSTHQPSAHQQSKASTDTKAGVPGGTVARDHSASCDLAGATTFSGNWTHGAYVRAAKAADKANVQAAAKSPCGKPMNAHGARG